MWSVVDILNQSLGLHWLALVTRRWRVDSIPGAPQTVGMYVSVAAICASTYQYGTAIIQFVFFVISLVSLLQSQMQHCTVRLSQLDRIILTTRNSSTPLEYTFCPTTTRYIL